MNSVLKIIGIGLLIINLQCVYAQRPIPVPYNSGTSINYVRSWDALAPEQSSALLPTRPLSDSRQTTQYFDGLGRQLQTVIKQGSFATGGTATDLIISTEYDEFGREVYKYLPFAANLTNTSQSISDGNFKLNPFQQQAEFFRNTNPKSPIANQGETYFYNQTLYEASPQNKITETQAPGNNWVGSGRGMKIQDWTNTDVDLVKVWKVTNSVTPGTFGTYALSSTNPEYDAGQLYKTITIDEAGKQTIEFKDKEGKVILKKVQLTSAADDGTGKNYSGWLCTYYIYDDLNNLRCVVQPAGVEVIKSDWTLSASSILAEQCFRYEYDSRNRLIMKKTPGAGTVNLVYDARDRLVMSQDANQQVQNKWMVTEYDALNRPVKTGSLTDANTPLYHRNLATASIAYPNTSLSNYELLTQTYYDDYTSITAAEAGFTSTINTSEISSNFFPASNTVFPYPQAVSQQKSNTGMVTGKKIKVAGTASQYLYTVIYYDDKNRAIQIKTTNITGGIDISTSQYSFDGKLLVNKLSNNYKWGTDQSHNIVTKNTYDAAGRLTTIQKSIDNTSSKTIVSNSYDELGQLSSKKLAPNYNSGNGLSTLTYDYNIRGWPLGLNRSTVLALNSTSTRRFGYELAYDKATSITGRTFAAPQYNGNIAGVVWRSSGDGIRRKYDFSYDNANRLMQALFEQNDPKATSWGSSVVNYTVKMGDGINTTSAYDNNGNIKRMQQWGLEINGSTQIDDMAYSYFTNSNKLKAVTEQGTGTINHNLGDFTDKNTTTVDYGYDVNGNLITDLNKSIMGATGTDVTSTGPIAYNYLNLPRQITVNNDDGTTLKGTITYTYDAEGNKLKKVTVETNYFATITTTTVYIAGFVYESRTTVPPGIGDPDYIDPTDYSNVLQFVGHEEGRIRYKAADNTVTPAIPVSYPFDYFIKDHLGNVRMVLTEEVQTDAYPVASMETAQTATEEAIYSNLNTTRTAKPSGYPADTYTNPNNNVARVKAAAGSQKIGPAIILKVMSGDQFNIRVNSWYKLNSITPGAPIDPLTDLLSVLTGSIASVSGGKATSSQLTSSGVLTPGTTSFLSNHSYTTGRPKAYINWVLFDEQFKYVISTSGFEQVGADQVFTTHTKNNLPVNVNGYLYIYVSNETPNIDVFFDNLQVTHIRGPLTEETHYYPFGLTMAGISSKAAGSLINKKGFNGNELQNKEFSDGSGLELYDFNARTYDEQTGRFIEIDPTPEDGDQESLTPYQFSGNNPSTFNDPNGKCPWCDVIVDGLESVATATVATASVAVDNVLGTNVTGAIANSGAVPTTQTDNWNTAVTSANNASVVAGTAATVGGSGIATGSAVATLASGGTSSIVTAPAFVVGAATAIVGTVVTANANKNLANGNGLIKGAESNPQPSSRAARRDAMRQQDIPTSQQPTKQKQTSAGRVLEYDVSKPGGGTTPKQAQQQTKDRNHGSHWEVGTPKKGGQKDPAGRDRLQNDKSKSFY